jgi:hypothetical protein
MGNKMKVNNRGLWKGRISKFWKTAGRYRKLLIGLGISIFVLVIVGGALQPIFFPILNTSDILLPEGHFNTSIVYIENVKTGYFNPDPSYPPEVNSYLEKSMAYNLGFEKANKELIKPDAFYPVTANGKDRILMVGSPSEAEGRYHDIYLLDTQYKILDQDELGGIYTVLVSIKFTDRAWFQSGPDGSGEYISMYEMNFSGDKIHKKQIGGGGSDYTGNETYKIINPSTNPRIVLYKGNGNILFLLFYLPFFVQYFLLINFPYVLLFILFLIFRKPLKPHQIYIRKTFLSLFKQHPHD